MKNEACGCGMRPKTKEEQNADLRKDAEKIVSDMERYSDVERSLKAAEVKAAFPPVTKTTAKAEAKKPAAKKTPKSPKPAGMSKGSHSGDAC
jgi:hypothetical protein